MVDHWLPRSSANSIDMVAFVLSYAQPIPDLALQKALMSQEAIARKAGLSDVKPMQGFQIAFGAPGASAPLPLSGRMMTAVESADGPFDQGFSEQVQFDAQSLIYRTTKYTSWSEVSGRYFEICGAVLTGLADVINPAAVRLEYLDRFAHDGSAGTTSAAGLLRAGSKYLAPHIFEEQDLWHSHTGAFLPKKNGRTNLLQVNADALNVSNGIENIRTIQIMTAREDRYPPNSIELDRGHPDILSANLNEMHEELKGVYSAIISDEAAVAVGLAK